MNSGNRLKVTDRKKTHKGIADILGSKRGRFFAFEVKRPGKNPEPRQIEWLRRVAGSGGYACITRSLPDAIEAWNEI